jgi:hypothetical protein
LIFYYIFAHGACPPQLVYNVTSSWQQVTMTFANYSDIPDFMARSILGTHCSAETLKG